MKSQRKAGMKNKKDSNTNRPLNKVRPKTIAKKDQRPKSYRKSSIPQRLRCIKKKAKELMDYVPDTNVLLSSWQSLFSFDEHNVYIVRQVWRELDKHKKGFRDINHNARAATRVIESLISGATPEERKNGIPLIPPKSIANGRNHSGHLFFDFSLPILPKDLDIDLNIEEPDDKIIMVCLSMKANGKNVVFISRDGNARGTAQIAGLPSEPPLEGAITEEYEEGEYKGYHLVPTDVWKMMDDPQIDREGNWYRYTMKSSFFKKVNPNELLIFPEDGLELAVLSKPNADIVVAETFQDYQKDNPTGLIAKDNLQGFALHLLVTPAVAALSIGGKAGSGKTYLACGAGMEQVGPGKPYIRMILTMPASKAFEKLGFLPGREDEKISPLLGGMEDNLELLTGGHDMNDTEKTQTKALIEHFVQIKAIELMQGRSLHNTYLVIDEVENMEKGQLKMILTRLGPGSKIVLLGNVAQIDNDLVTEFTNGLTIFINTFPDCVESGHITLNKGVRHPFANIAEERL